jgi:methionyl-tRNA synthetase
VFESPMGLSTLIADQWKTYGEKMDGLEMHLALQAVVKTVDAGNGYMQTHQPWSKEHTSEKRLALLTEFAELLRHIGLMLLPFIPETAQKISTQLGVPYAAQMSEKNFVITDAMKQWGTQTDWKAVGEPSILFAPVE